MTIGSRLLARLGQLPRARTFDVSVERDLETKTPDGAVLLADRWYPTDLGANPPVILIRTPYGRKQFGFIGRLFAERGYQVVMQSCRGTFGSGGEWIPFRNERADGETTLEWLADQPWFTGSVGTFGPSYLGLTQWAVVDSSPDSLKAMALNVTSADVRKAVIYPGESLALETTLTWIHQVEHQELNPAAALRAAFAGRKILRSAYYVVPLADADVATVGHHVGFYQDWVTHEAPLDPWWDPVKFGRHPERAAPATLVGGWYDVFLPSQVADFEALRAAGRDARITIGPWTHTSPRGLACSVRDGLEWFDHHLRGAASARRQHPVRIFIMGSRRWVDLASWPPPADQQRWHLHAGGGLDISPPADSAPDSYRYDPADPTPGVGGPSLDWRNAGPKGQRGREARSDVLLYTSDPLTHDLTVAGPLTAELHLRSTVDHVDFFVRLCDVSPRGRSRNLSDGIIRLRPGDVDKAPDGSFPLTIQMWPTANTFRRDHRIRLQVSSGAHPLFVRNTGSGEPLATATRLVPVDVEVLHDAVHPSAVVLSVTS